MPPYEGSNQKAYDMYQTIGRQRHGKPPDVIVDPAHLSFACWVGRYWRLGYRGLERWIIVADPVARELLREQSNAKRAVRFIIAR